MGGDWGDDIDRDGFGERIRALRPEPHEDFIRGIQDSLRVRAQIRRPARQGLRLAASIAFVMVLVGALAGVGGFAYASSAVQRTAKQVRVVVAAGPQTVTESPADTQYRPGKGCGDINHIHDRVLECKVVINAVTVKEGNSGFRSATFTVSLSASAIDTVTVDFATANGSATEPSDYVAGAGTLVFNPGQSARTVTVPVVADTIREPNESFQVVLSNPSPNAVINVSEGIATIKNDD
jgi:Calx-beta domain